MGYSDKQIQEGYGISNEGSSGSCALPDSGTVVDGCMGCLQNKVVLKKVGLPFPNFPNMFIITYFNRMRYQGIFACEPTFHIVYKWQLWTDLLWKQVGVNSELILGH